MSRVLFLTHAACCLDTHVFTFCSTSYNLLQQGALLFMFHTLTVGSHNGDNNLLILEQNEKKRLKNVFGVQQHSKGTFHATSHTSLLSPFQFFHYGEPDSLLLNNVFQH
jgi:hypothetical protein